MSMQIDILGKKFHRLTVIKKLERKSKNRQSYWLCSCECGNKTEVRGDGLRSGKTKSCGCLQKEIVTKMKTLHGMSGTKTYTIWENMISRTTNPNNKYYHNYGGRGISVEDAWKIFSNFLADMGECPKGLLLERKDNEQGYSRENCIWADWETQANNRRTNTYLVHNGKRLTLSQWAKELGINRNTIGVRLFKGMPTEKILGVSDALTPGTISGAVLV